MTAYSATLDRPRAGSLVRTLQRITKILFVTLVVRPVLWLFLGLEVRNAQRLPKDGPAIFIANHNSHFDALAILSILELPLLAQAHPVGAEDYFFKTPFRAAFSRWCLGILPLARTAPKDGRRDVLEGVVKSLEHGKIVIFFPEGSRGGAGRVGSFKRGIAALAKRCPNVPIVPLYLAGFSKVLPKGASFPLPMICSISIGEAVVEVDTTARRAKLPELLHQRVVALGGDAEEQVVGATSVSLLCARRDS
jgi:1-acyl-sn-glycerol-3-phosphate acyltransferase